MKSLILFISIVMPMTLFSQQLKVYKPIKDPNYWGVKVYSGSGYSGTAIYCTTRNQSYTFPQGIGSVKVYGPWKLVQGNQEITEDRSSYNGSGGGSWTLIKTSDRYSGIVYTGANYSGQATYLKQGVATLTGNGTFRSLKLVSPAKIGWYGVTGLQKCLRGDHPTLQNVGARIEINTFKYGKCSSVGGLGSN